MIEQSSARAFEPMKFPLRAVTGISAGRYRVYNEAKRFRLVEAPTAAEAIKVSGVDKPLRIIRDVPAARILLDCKTILE